MKEQFINTNPKKGYLAEMTEFQLNENWTTGSVRDENNELSIRYAWYSKSKTPPKKFVVFLNGRTEFIEKYSYLPEDLQLDSDCGFLSFDHRGQGDSSGARGHSDSYDLFCKDARIVIDKIVGKKPYAMVCHSMGGLIGLYGHLNGYFSAKKLVLSSPLLGIPDTPIHKSISRPLAKTITALKIGPISAHFGQNNKTAFSKNKLTHSSDRYDRIQNAPFQIPSVTFGWVNASFAAIDNVFSSHSIEQLNTDVFIMGSPADKVVEPSAWKEWISTASRIHPKKVDFELVHGARHELFSEIPKYYDQAIALTRREISDFLKS